MLSENDITFLTSNLYHNVFDTIAWIVFTFSILVFGVLMWIVIKKSPKEMKVYKWYIVVNHSLLFIIELVIGTVHPRFIQPFPGILAGGIPLGNDHTNRIFFEFIIAIFGCYIYSCLLMFIYRYLQTIGKDRWLEIFESKKIFLLHIGILTGNLTSVIIPLQSYWVTKEELKKLYQNCCLEIYVKIEDQNVFGLREMPNLSILMACLYMFLTLSLGFYCTVSVYRNLGKIQTTLSPKTYSLYKKLMNILVFELTLYSLFGGVPLFLLALNYKLGFPYSMSISSIAFFFGGCFPPVSAITLIIYIDSYRKALLRYIGKMFKIIDLWKNTNTGNSTIHVLPATSAHFQIPIG